MHNNHSTLTSAIQNQRETNNNWQPVAATAAAAAVLKFHRFFFFLLFFIHSLACRFSSTEWRACNWESHSYIECSIFDRDFWRCFCWRLKWKRCKFGEKKKEEEIVSNRWRVNRQSTIDNMKYVRQGVFNVHALRGGHRRRSRESDMATIIKFQTAVHALNGVLKDGERERERERIDLFIMRRRHIQIHGHRRERLTWNNDACQRR